MHIGFDAKRLFTNTAGLRNYAHNITEALVRFYPQHTYTFYTPSFNERFFSALPFLQQPNVRVETPSGFMYKMLPSLWRSRGVVKAITHNKTDIYHGLSNEMPYELGTPVKTVVTIHDIIFKHFPEYYNWADRRVFDAKTRYAVKRANAIIAINNQTKADLIKYYNGQADKITYVEQPVNPVFLSHVTQSQLEDVRRLLNLPPKYLLYVGTIEPRKNLMLLIEALATFTNDDRPNLVVVGKSTSYLEKIQFEIERHNLQKYIYIYHNINNAELPAIYRLAQLYVNPSRFEGFGAPLLEALTCGTPVLCSSGAYFKDTFGERCTYAAIDDLKAWVDNIYTLYHQNYRPTYNLDVFTGEAVAHKIMALYEGLIR